jgi:hypothetical protein
MLASPNLLLNIRIENSILPMSSALSLNALKEECILIVDYMNGGVSFAEEG